MGLVTTRLPGGHVLLTGEVLEAQVQLARASRTAFLYALAAGIVAAALADAIDEADGLHRLLDTALEISRTEAGIGRDQFAHIDLRPMLDDIAEVYGPLAEERGLSIEVDAQAELDVIAHRELLQRALSNLVDNALKYAEGGSAIRIDASIVAGGSVDLFITDDGPGLTEADRARAAQRFVRLDPARGGTGAGLGLSLVQTIVHLHGGDLRLKSSHPRGLSAHLVLPIAWRSNSPKDLA